MSPVSNPNSPISREAPLSSETIITEIVDLGPVPEWSQRDSAISSWIASSIAYVPKAHYASTPADHPQLPTPIQGEIQPSAVEPAIQDIVRGFIAKEIMVLLAPVRAPEDQNDIFNNLIKGTPLQNPTLSKTTAQIKEQVETKVKQEARLENFSLSALYSPNKEAWIQTPLLPYNSQQKAEIQDFFAQARNNQFAEMISSSVPPLTDAQIGLINKALTGGKVDPSVNFILKAIDAAAIQETQKKYNLPSSWTPNTKEVNNWKPVNSGIVNPKSIADARNSRLTQNTETTMTGFYDAIMDAIWGFREQLEESQVLIAQQMLDNTTITEANQKARNDIADAQMAETLAAQDKQGKLEKLGFSMKIIGPILATLSIAASTLSIVLTLGAATPVAVAGIIVGVSMLTYSLTQITVSATTGTTLTSEAMQWVKETMGDILEDLTPAQAIMVQISMVVGIAVLLTVVLIATTVSGNAATTAKVAGRTIAKFALQSIQVAGRQLAVQAAIMILMGSGLLLEIPRRFLELTDMNDKAVEALTYVIFILETIAVIGLAAKTMPGSVANSTTQPKSSFTESLKNAATALTTETKKSLEATAQMITDMFQSTARKIQNLPSEIANIPSNIKNSTTDTLKGWASIFTQQGSKELIWDPVVGDFVETNIGKYTTGEKLGIITNRIAQMAPAAANLPASISQATMQFQLANIYQEQADLQKQTDEIEALLELLDTVMNEMQTSTSDTFDVMQTITSTIDRMSQAVSKSTQKLTDTIQG